MDSGQGQIGGKHFAAMSQGFHGRHVHQVFGPRVAGLQPPAFAKCRLELPPMRLAGSDQQLCHAPFAGGDHDLVQAAADARSQLFTPPLQLALFAVQNPRGYDFPRPTVQLVGAAQVGISGDNLCFKMLVVVGLAIERGQVSDGGQHQRFFSVCQIVADRPINVAEIGQQFVLRVLAAAPLAGENGLPSGTVLHAAVSFDGVLVIDRRQRILLAARQIGNRDPARASSGRLAARGSGWR